MTKSKIDLARQAVAAKEAQVKAIRQRYLDNPRPSLRDDIKLALESLRLARLEYTALRVQAAQKMIGNDDREIK